MATKQEEKQSSGLYTNVQNVKVYYEWYKHPEPKATVVFIHGFLSSAFSFRKIIPLIIKDFSAIALDLPGFGKSEKSLTFYYSYQNYGKLIIEIISKLKLKKVILAGHSMGGQIALFTAKQAPEIIDKLILIASSGYYRKARRSAVIFSYLPFFSWFVKQWVEGTKDIRQHFVNDLIDKTLLNDDLINGYAKPFYEKNFYKSMIRLMRHREGDLSQQELKKIDTPSILIWGREDKSVPLVIAERLKSDLSNSRLVVVDNAGHLICEEKPEEISKELFNSVPIR